MHVDHDTARDAFLDQLDTFRTVAGGLTDRELLRPSRCTGWAGGEVLVHVHMGLQEMLLGLVTPAGGAPDTSASGYWRHTAPSTDPDADDLAAIRFVRLVAAAYRRPTGVVGHLRPTAEGVRSAVTHLGPGAVPFQGLVLSTGDFLATWAVELAVHQLDLRHPAPPAPAALRLGRQTVEALLGDPTPAAWSDETVLLLGAGRLAPGAEHGAFAGRLPVLG